MITRNVILFGPPGIGKSSLIGELKARGFGAIDLEDLYPNRIRFQIPNMVQNTFLGAADLNPKRKYNNAVKVLLSATQNVYDMRRTLRDADHPEKAGQRHHKMSDWTTQPVFYDIILQGLAEDTVQDTADELIEYLKKGGYFDEK